MPLWRSSHRSNDAVRERRPPLVAELVPLAVDLPNAVQAAKPAGAAPTSPRATETKAAPQKRDSRSLSRRSSVTLQAELGFQTNLTSNTE